MRIALILSALRAGGTERVVAILANRLIDEGWSVTVVSFDAPGEPVFPDFHPHVRLVRLAIPAGARTTLLRIVALHRELARGKYNLAVSFLTKINALALCAALPLKLPLLISERNNQALQPMHLGWRWALRLLYRRADLIVMQTAASLARLPPRQRRRAVVIPNPVQIPRKAEKRRTRSLIAGVGRLVDQKGFPDLISAFREVARLAPGARLAIWGEGPLHDRLQQQIAAEGLSSKAQLAGLSQSHRDWTGRADIFVLPSRYEGFPNVLLEAMAAGLPVIACDCDFGPRDLVRHEVNGLLVPAADRLALASAMMRMLNDPDFADQLGRAARSTALNYDSELIVAKWTGVFRHFGGKKGQKTQVC
jgi:glycosyltransferase involved in cell wall biosynthesis